MPTFFSLNRLPQNVLLTIYQYLSNKELLVLTRAGHKERQLALATLFLRTNCPAKEDQKKLIRLWTFNDSAALFSTELYQSKIIPALERHEILEQIMGLSLNRALAHTPPQALVSFISELISNLDSLQPNTQTYRYLQLFAPWLTTEQINSIICHVTHRAIINSQAMYMIIELIPAFNETQIDTLLHYTITTIFSDRSFVIDVHLRTLTALIHSASNTLIHHVFTDLQAKLRDNNTYRVRFSTLNILRCFDHRLSADHINLLIPQLVEMVFSVGYGPASPFLNSLLGLCSDDSLYYIFEELNKMFQSSNQQLKDRAYRHVSQMILSLNQYQIGLFIKHSFNILDYSQIPLEQLLVLSKQLDNTQLMSLFYHLQERSMVYFYMTNEIMMFYKNLTTKCTLEQLNTLFLEQLQQITSKNACVEALETINALTEILSLNQIELLVPKLNELIELLVPQLNALQYHQQRMIIKRLLLIIEKIAARLTHTQVQAVVDICSKLVEESELEHCLKISSILNRLPTEHLTNLIELIQNKAKSILSDEESNDSQQLAALQMVRAMLMYDQITAHNLQLLMPYLFDVILKTSKHVIDMTYDILFIVNEQYLKSFTIQLLNKLNPEQWHEADSFTIYKLIGILKNHFSTDQITLISNHLRFQLIKNKSQSSKINREIFGLVGCLAPIFGPDHLKALLPVLFEHIYAQEHTELTECFTELAPRLTDSQLDWLFNKLLNSIDKIEEDTFKVCYLNILNSLLDQSARESHSEILWNQGTRCYQFMNYNLQQLEQLGDNGIMVTDLRHIKELLIYMTSEQRSTIIRQLIALSSTNTVSDNRRNEIIDGLGRWALSLLQTPNHHQELKQMLDDIILLTASFPTLESRLLHALQERIPKVLLQCDIVIEPEFDIDDTALAPPAAKRFCP